MTMRLFPSRVRWLRVTALPCASLCAIALGQGCSDSDVQLVGVAGAAPQMQPAEPEPNEDPPAEMTPSEMEPSEPEPPETNGGAGGAPSIDPPEVSMPGSAGSLPTIPPEPEPPATDPPATDPPTTDPPTTDPPTTDPPVTDPPTEPPSEPPTTDPPVDPPPTDPPATDPPPSGQIVNCGPAQGAFPNLKLTPIATGLKEPTFATASPGDDSRLFVLEKGGAIRIVRDGVLLNQPFLDLSVFVDTFNEQGLVGLAFHPNYAENGRFFVQYAYLPEGSLSSAPHEIVLSEFVRSADSLDKAVFESERVLMIAEQPASIHLAGMLAFSPTDGMLYVSRGDGGTTESQNVDSEFGKLLRIDVDTESDGRPYGIPEGNLNDVVWSLGLRNPWRFSFDACVGDIYIGDVGEATFEEINFEPAGVNGLNFGWKTLEGTRCFEDPTLPCDSTGLTPPAVLLERDFGCAVIGGYVYRGQNIPALRGTYIYTDYCSGNFGAFRMQAGQVTDRRDITQNINPADISPLLSFGTDNAGELYVMSETGLYRIDPE